MNARVSIPADPHERRRLWREWIHMDVPAVENRQQTLVRRVTTVVDQITELESETIGCPGAGTPDPRSKSVARVNEYVRKAKPSSAPGHPKGTDWLPDVIDAPEGVIHGLKRAISECLVGGTLPITDRERLITRSLKLGLNRFEANLLIAAVQNRHRENPTLPPVENIPRRRWSLLQVLGLALAVEVAAFVALIRIYF